MFLVLCKDLGLMSATMLLLPEAKIRGL